MPLNAHSPEPSQTPLREIALLFLKLGLTAFGGPAAHIAMMEEEVVRRRGWLSHEEFLDLLGATNLIPGPNSTEMAIHIGYKRAGWRGLWTAGACFILPAFLIVTAMAWGYTRSGRLPAMQALLYGVKPVVIAVIVQALWNLGKKAMKTKTFAALALTAALANASGIHELAVIFGAGLIAAFFQRVPARSPGGLSAAAFSVKEFLPLAAIPAASVPAPPGLAPVFFFFLKVGSVLFGSGYVLVAFLHADLVERWHWISEAQLFDAIAVGQITPGPVFTTASFIGFLLKGFPGAAAATAGIFLPAFLLVGISAPLIPKLRRSKTAAAFLDGVNAGSLAVMAVVAFWLGRSAVVDLPTSILAAASALLLVRFRINSTWLILAGGIFGTLQAFIR